MTVTNSGNGDEEEELLFTILNKISNSWIMMFRHRSHSCFLRVGETSQFILIENILNSYIYDSIGKQKIDPNGVSR